MNAAATQEIATILVSSALEEMSRISGAAIGDILSAMITDPAGNAALRFRAYLNYGVENADRLIAA
jgi:hypothetical protein